MRRKSRQALPNHLVARCRRLRAAIRAKNLDAFLATDVQDVSYLSGFSGEDSFLFLTSRSVVLITDSRYVEQAQRECPGVGLSERHGPITEAVAKLAVKKKAQRIGFEPAAISLTQYKNLARYLRPARLLGCKGMVHLARRCKDNRELAAIRRSLKVAEDSFRAVRAWIRPGMTEMQVAAKIELEMKNRGSSQPAFPTIVACGARTSMPHIRPSTARIRAAQPILIDWGATVAGYKSDLTRVLFIDRICQSLKSAYQTVDEASRAALKMIRPGISAKQVDAAAREIIHRQGYGRYFGHGLGHGIGLDVHEGPTIGPKSEDILEEGMVFTVEPGVYLPGQGGIRIEKDVLVTSKGCRVLSKLPGELTWAVCKRRS